jgi:hypothetical protein
VGDVVAVQAGGTVGGEGGEGRAAVDDVAGPDEGVRVGAGDGAGLVAGDGAFDVGALRGECAIFQDEAEEVEALLEGVGFEGAEGGSEVS